jgi:hypothetical protein
MRKSLLNYYNFCHHPTCRDSFGQKAGYNFVIIHSLFTLDDCLPYMVRLASVSWTMAVLRQKWTCEVQVVPVHWSACLNLRNYSTNFDNIWNLGSSLKYIYRAKYFIIFIGLIHVKLKSNLSVFSKVAPRTKHDKYRCLLPPSSGRSASWWRQQATLKRRWSSTRLHGATT